MTSFQMSTLKADSHIHFVGIGGISMSGLAEILIRRGYQVSGSDLRPSTLTHKLEKLGAKVFIGHQASNIEGSALIVHTAAVKEMNPELQAAAAFNIPIIERAVLLGEIMRQYKYPIAIAGTHGKTTTTSMLSHILLYSKLDPTIMVGGELDAIGGNIRAGSSEYFITEACEYVESFLKFHPYIAIILNVEADHLDYYQNLAHIITAFQKFAQLVPPEGKIIVCGDDLSALQSVAGLQNTITYGINDSNNWKASQVVYNQQGFPSFAVSHHGKEYCKLQLMVPGLHNVLNATAAFACALSLGIKTQDIVAGLESFVGTHRRFEKKGTYKGALIIDDYAHHPTEIQATLSAAAQIPRNRLWCIFQPHTYTRTLSLMDDFSQSFEESDRVIVSDIYAAREKDNGKVHSKQLTEAINRYGKNAIYMSDFGDIVNYLDQHLEANDIVITMGAGNIHEIGEKLLQIG